MARGSQNMTHFKIERKYPPLPWYQKFSLIPLDSIFPPLLSLFEATMSWWLLAWDILRPQGFLHGPWAKAKACLQAGSPAPQDVPALLPRTGLQMMAQGHNPQGLRRQCCFNPQPDLHGLWRSVSLFSHRCPHQHPCRAWSRCVTGSSLEKGRGPG